MEDDGSNPFRRMSSRSRKMAPRMAAVLASTDNRTQANLESLPPYVPSYLKAAVGPLNSICWRH